MLRYLQYEIIITKEIFKPTWTFINKYILVGMLIAVLAGMIIGLYEWMNYEQLPTSIWVGLLAGIFAAFLISGSVLLWNTLVAPYRIWNRQVKELASSESTYDPDLGAVLEELYVRGDLLLQASGTDFDDNMDIQLVSDWVDEVSELLKQHIPKERFMFYSAGGIFNDDPIALIGVYDSTDKRRSLQTKLEKLRLIIGRYEDNI